ncbi:MAG: family 16 glycoside hydrolase [Planctomycetota bacterium]|jgi:sugar lactone lactonase YvrE
MMRVLVTMTLLSLVSPIGFAAPEDHAGDAGWVDLFDGRSLEGWIQRGGEAKYEAVDGTIVGTAVPNTPNSFLCTEKPYGDFVLHVEFQVDPDLNSGVQIRSNSLPDYKNGRVHGYQVEIDASDRGWSGGIYDESRRGWLFTLEDNPKARYAFKQGQWNTFHVEAIGDSIRTWINGVPAADLADPMTQSGFIALQVHGIGDREDRPQVRWRNVRVKDLGTSAWKPLYDGKTLEGWTVIPGGNWEVVDGVIRGTSPASEARHGILRSDREYEDFTVKVVYRVTKGNSGFYFRAEPTDGRVGLLGFQAEIDGARDGGLYETGGRAWVAGLSPEASAKIIKKGDWNEMSVSAHGRRIVVHVNHRKTAKLENDPGRTKGYFGLQLHGGQEMDVEFRSIELLEGAAERPVARPPAAGAEGAELPVVPEGAQVKKLADGFRFTEGPAVGPDGRVYFSDVPNERIMVFDFATGKVTVHREGSGRANGLMFTPAGALIACEGGARQLTRQFQDEITVLADGLDGNRLNSPNDLALDGKGGIYFTDPRYGSRDGMEMEVEGVYYVPRRGELKRVVGDLARPNGLVLSLDGKTLYVADNGAKTIVAFTVEPDGSLAGGRPFAEMDADAPGGGDGMTLDCRGNVYCAGQGHVWIWNPEGGLVAKIAVPESPANCTFAGPEGKTLFITARTGIYAVELNVCGG